MQGDYYQLPTGRVAALDTETDFPPVSDALTEPNGLLAIGGDLSASRLIYAYSEGIFPWFNQGEPILWWSPDPRMVLFPTELKVSRSLAKTLKTTHFEVRFNTAFHSVMNACAQSKRPNQNGTWITDEMIKSYCALHDLGYAHSAEAWLDDTLVGGLYGIKIGHMFYGESMFHHKTDASKIAFVHMVQTLAQQGVGMIDCQMHTAHLASLGARPIARMGFLQILKKLVHYNPIEAI